VAKQHGRHTVITVDGSDISAYCRTSSYEKNADVHDVSGYGDDDKRKSGGQRDNKFTCGGVYDTTAGTGPRAVLHAEVGNTLAVTRQVEGAGTGKPNDAFNAVLTKYVETSPVDDMVTWSAEFDVDGEVTTTAQA